MRMLLTSNGLTNPTIRDCFDELLGKPTAESRIAVVIDAFMGFPHDKGGLLDHLQHYRGFGWANFDVISLLAAPRPLVEARLRSADVIYCYGGSNHWLAHAWRESGLAPVLAELLDDKVYLGMSDGSMIFSRAHAATVDAFNNRDELTMFGLDAAEPAVALFDWYVIGHLGSEFLPEQTDEWATRTAARLGSDVWYLDD
ncbi:MAG TPA: Type 1 glutamine amidotransferase-like domain-containing protein, partial [Ilumatobacteraceae bacterium]|nr:Type 1 glutamine amidotransferase-like domain-containing protein [Ilumatobacteraceae bacterium]